MINVKLCIPISSTRTGERIGFVEKKSVMPFVPYRGTKMWLMTDMQVIVDEIVWFEREPEEVQVWFQNYFPPLAENGSVKIHNLLADGWFPFV